MRTCLRWAPLLLLGVGLLPGCPGKSQLPIDSAAEAKRLEHQVHDEVNKVRRQHGLSVLKWDDALSRIATKHSRDMSRRDYFDHVSPSGGTMAQRYEAGRYRCHAPINATRYATGGENLFLTHRSASYILHPNGQRQETELRSIRDVATIVVEGWMTSPGHRENLLTPHWRKEGIGVFLDDDGEIYVTQNFC